MNVLKKLFRGKAQGKHFKESLTLTNKRKVPLNAAAYSLGGVVVGGAAGAGAGLLIGRNAVNKVPIQTVTVDHFEAVTQEELMGYKPPNDYVRGTSRPSDDGLPTERVFRNNPVYGVDGNPQLSATTSTFSGRGTPQPVEWQTENIEHHKMDPDNNYTYRSTRDTERYVARHKTVSEMVPEYYRDSDGNMQTRYNFRTKKVPVYRERTVGFHQRYSPNIDSRVVGTVEKPVNVNFEHGVNVASYVVKGAIAGALIGALAGGIASAMEEHFLPQS